MSTTINASAVEKPLIPPATNWRRYRWLALVISIISGIGPYLAAG